MGTWRPTTAGWQWSAGTGTDAQPFFRILNPVLQGAKFDPDGAYVKHWVPELERVPALHIHAPWKIPPAIAHQARFEPGRDYPFPIVDHASQRPRALAMYKGPSDSIYRSEKTCDVTR